MRPMWTAIEIETWQRRYQRLKTEEKRSESEATELADSMQRRDADGDDRRICPECRNWRNRRCTEGHKSLPYILQRHDCMDLRGSRAAAQPQASAG